MKKFNTQKVIFFFCLFVSLIFTTLAFQNFTVKKKSLGNLKTDGEESISILRSALEASDDDHARSHMALNGEDEKKRSRRPSSVEVESTIYVDEMDPSKWPAEEEEEASNDF